MIVELISEYLTTHKRLVVPNLGTFIVKAAGESVLFSNLIKTDDGVLRSLLTENGVSELEAAGAVDRFVFEVNYRLQQSGVCRMDGFGELRKSVNGTMTFVYEPTTAGESLDGETTRHATPEPVDRADKVADAVAEKIVVPESRTQPADEADAVEGGDVRSKDREGSRGSAAERGAVRNVRNDRDEVRAIYDEPHITVSPKMRPADYVKGLRYDKGRKAHTGHNGSWRSRRKSDRIMIIAIVAASLAIAALAYGYYCDLRASRMDADIYDEVQTDADGAVRNPDLDYIEPYEK